MDKSIGFEIRSISNRIKRFLNAQPAFQSCEMRGIYGYVIGFIYENPHRDIFQKDIEEEFSIRRSSVTNLLCKMENHGLIERKSVSGDGRLKKVELTQKAIDMHKQIVREIDGLERELSRGLSESEKRTLLDLLERVKSNTDRLGEDETKDK